MAEEYAYETLEPTWNDDYIYARVEHWVRRCGAERVFELGCGNGHTLRRLAGLDVALAAIEISESGVRQSRAVCPSAQVELGSAYDDLAAKFGHFDVVVSVDVIEHLYDPHTFAKNCAALLRPGGLVVVSTPYHGYLKNVLIALSGRFDAHHNPLWHHGHIKAFSRATLRALFEECGLTSVALERLGRLPPLAKSLLGVFQKPATGALR